MLLHPCVTSSRLTILIIIPKHSRKTPNSFNPGELDLDMFGIISALMSSSHTETNLQDFETVVLLLLASGTHIKTTLAAYIRPAPPEISTNVSFFPPPSFPLCPLFPPLYFSVCRDDTLPPPASSFTIPLYTIQRYRPSIWLTAITPGKLGLYILQHSTFQPPVFLWFPCIVATSEVIVDVLMEEDTRAVRDRPRRMTSDTVDYRLRPRLVGSDYPGQSDCVLP
ncbi:hypothetical protein PM082_011454 [Marasmius tenuissimus]|nr:hypothetical protein PM082_011454 [Marasmius tenuissimus]